MEHFSRLIARVVLLGLYAGALVAVTLGRWQRRPRPLTPGQRLKVLAAGTFYNRGWLRAHARPIVGARPVDYLVVVTDSPLDPLPATRYACPPAWLARVLTRAPARLLQVGWTAWREGSDVLVGYHIMPNALICLVVAALQGRRAVYQMTGGPAQVVGGGAESENVLQSRIGKGSPLLESLLMRLVAHFDAIVVRGASAAAFLRERGLGGRVFIIPAGIHTGEFRPGSGERPHDVVYVGRLAPVKGCDLLQEVLVGLVRARPDTRAVVLGDGPLREGMATAFAEAGVADHVRMPGRRDDVAAWLAASRVFLLTSPDEGLSIALLEAMCAGVVPVVADVGELRDVVRSGETGFLVDSRRPEEYVERVRQLLDAPERLAALSEAGREAATAHAGLEAVSRKWDVLLESLLAPDQGPTADRTPRPTGDRGS